MGLYPAGQNQLTPLTGSEQVAVDGGGATLAFATTQQIANLAGAGVNRTLTALNTVGAGTLAAAALIGGVVARGGSQSNTAFTDTTATGAQLDAALANPQVGQSWEFTYQNTTNATATIAAGASGMTVSGITAVPGGSSARYIVTRTGAATYTMVGFLQAGATGSDGTFVANQTTPVTVTDSRVTANSAIIITLKTVGGTVGVSLPAIKTITAGTGFTVAALALDTSTYNYLIIG